MSGSLIRVVLADDHMIVREGLRALLDQSHSIRVIAEVADGRAAIEACVEHQPDVVVMDLGMPQLNGVDATREVKRLCPNTAVLVLSMYSSEEYVRPAIRAGATGYLLKGSGLSDLVAAIEAVARGEAFVSPGVAKLLLDDRRVDASSGGGESLTRREREILVLVAEGKSSADIATQLGLSVKTVEGHRGRIMVKLEVHNVAGMVRHAIRLGLVSPA